MSTPTPHADASSPLAGAPNFRPVAPLPAAGGRTLRPRRIFRSDALHRLTDEDLARLQALRIGTVLDLRRDDERASMPSRWPPGTPTETLTFDGGPDLQAVRAGSWRALVSDPTFDASRAHGWMLETYGRMPVALAPAVREAALRLARDDAAGAPGTVLVHCTAGKDRTGFVVAVLLHALGVPREAIVDDYLESMRRRPAAALARVLIENSALQPSPRLAAAIETIAGVHPDFLDTALVTAERTHGSLDAYLADCGIGTRQRDALRNALLD